MHEFQLIKTQITIHKENLSTSNSMQPQPTPPSLILPPIASLNLPPPVITQHSYTMYHQKKHMMLINGEEDFTSQDQQLSHKRKINFQDYTTLSISQDDGKKLVDITRLRKCQRCHNWIYEDEVKEHMTFHGAIVLDYLFLGDKFSAQSRKELIERLQATHVVNAASQLPNSFIQEGIKYFNLSLLDTLGEDVITPCLKAAEFIETVFSEGGKVFVHCAMGKSRSVAVILVYLMKYKALSLEDALAHVKAKRHIIKPNPSYLKQLQMFELALKTPNNSTQTQSL